MSASAKPDDVGRLKHPVQSVGGRAPMSGEGGLRWAFGTNGLGNHRLDEALVLLADLGYDGVALTLDMIHLDPYDPTLDVAKVRKRLGLAVVIETGGRYVIDPRRKHYPTLLHEAEDVARRVDFLKRAVRIGAELEAETVSFWSGTAPAGLGENETWARLTAGVEEVLEEAQDLQVQLAFEPEPGMFVDTIERWERLLARLNRPAGFGITLDLGHCHCLEPMSVPESIERVSPYLKNVQIEDMRRGVHEHLEFGEGEMDFPPILAALRAHGYPGLAGVELPRHSHAGAAVAESALKFLKENS